MKKRYQGQAAVTLDSEASPKLLIVTDLGLFKAYRLEKTPLGSPHLTELMTIQLEEAHRRIVEAVTDMAGQRGKPTQTHWGAPVTDDHNLRLEIKRRLIKKIAGHIRHVTQATDGLPVWLVTPREIGHAITEELPQTVRRRIEKTMAADLVNAPQAKLLKAIAAACRE